MRNKEEPTNRYVIPGTEVEHLIEAICGKYRIDRKALFGPRVLFSVFFLLALANAGFCIADIAGGDSRVIPEVLISVAIGLGLLVAYLTVATTVVAITPKRIMVRSVFRFMNYSIDVSQIHQVVVVVSGSRLRASFITDEKRVFLRRSWIHPQSLTDRILAYVLTRCKP